MKKLSKLFLVSSSLFSLSFMNSASASIFDSSQSHGVFGVRQNSNPAAKHAKSLFQSRGVFGGGQNSSFAAKTIGSSSRGFGSFGKRQNLSLDAKRAGSPFQGVGVFGQKSNSAAKIVGSPFQGFGSFGTAQNKPTTPAASSSQGFDSFGVAQQSNPTITPAVSPSQGFGLFGTAQNKPTTPVASSSRGFHFEQLKNNLDAAGQRLADENARTQQLRDQVEAQRLIVQQQEAKRIADEEAGRVELERLSAGKAETERLILQQTEAAQRADAERIEAQRVAAQEEANRVAAEQRETERMAAEQREIQRVARVEFLAQNLQPGIEFYGHQGKTLIQNPQYQGISNINVDLSPYPRIPRLHQYDAHEPQYNYLSLELPRASISNEILNKIFGDLALENISIFFLAQDSQENNIEFRPHYYIDSNIITHNEMVALPAPANNGVYEPIEAAIFNLGNTPSHFRGFEEGVFSPVAITTHPVGGHLVASPDNLQMDGFVKEQGALLASVVIGLNADGSKNKGALTIHYLPPQDNDDPAAPKNNALYNRLAAANTVEEGLIALQIDQLDDEGDFAGRIAHIAQTISDRRDREEG